MAPIPVWSGNLRLSLVNGDERMAKTPTVNVNLRLPPELHRALVELAASHELSLNSEIIAHLREGLSFLPTTRSRS